MKETCDHAVQVKIVLETVVTVEKTVIICKKCKKQISEPVYET